MTVIALFVTVNPAVTDLTCSIAFLASGSTVIAAITFRHFVFLLLKESNTIQSYLHNQDTTHHETRFSLAELRAFVQSLFHFL
jgi:hypothetical protein